MLYCVYSEQTSQILTQAHAPDQIIPNMVQFVKLSSKEVPFQWTRRHLLQLINVEISTHSDAIYDHLFGLKSLRR